MTNPDSVRIEPWRVAHLRGPQTVALRNAFQSEVKREIPAARNTTRVVDFKQVTDNEITILRRALSDRGITDVPGASKSVTLRVHPGVSIHMLAGDVAGSASLTLEAEFGDGTQTSVVGDARSGFGTEQAFHGALLSALHRLLLDKAFVAYVNR